jgi:acetolactate synthase small subunit
VNPYPYIDGEPLFTEMVRGYPIACVLTDKILHPKFLNEDFIFHHEKIVAEFKRVEKDGTDSPKVQAKIAAVLEKYYADAKIKEKQITEENWPGLAKEFQNEIYNITTDSIKVHIEMANKQIKTTKEILRLESYKGCLILVNDGVESFQPVTFLWAAFRLILHQYSGITYIITFPANVFAKSRKQPAPVQYWLGLDVEKAGKREGPFCEKLFHAWTGFAAHKTGIPAIGREFNDVEGFWKARNLPN